MFCTNCGAQVTAETRFCPQCGTTLGGAQPPPPPPVFAPAAAYTAPSGCQAYPSRWIGAAWTLVTGQLGMFALIFIVMTAVSTIVPLILQGPMIAGMHIVCWRVALGGRADLGDLFKGFNFFVPALAACIVITIFSFLGLFACIVGALVVSAMYQFTYLFIIDRKLDFWPAMQASHAIVKQDYFGFTIFLLALIGVQILGALACLVGLLVTLPMFYAAITVAYKELVGFASPEPPQ
ncbi:MAG: zinc-ribbon domain-containing protein [Acidobacteria bacterium]|nr:zinc-ribbon domain-containing protein [Acidobacteriota bacterium]